MKKITFLCIAVFCFAFCWQVNAQFTESFDTEIPASWTITDVDGGNTWAYSTAQSYAGGGSARITYDSNAHEDYLISPQFTVTAGVSDRISFWAASYLSYFESFDVLLSTSGTAPSDFTVVLGNEIASTNAPEFEQFSYDLSAHDGTPIYIAIRATGTDQFYLYIDEFVNDAAPSCTAAEVASADPVEDCDNSQFDIVVEFTTVGDATGVSDGTNTYPIVGTTATLDGDYAFGTDVDLTVVHSDSACDFDLDSTTFDACPPDNDDCSGAVELTVDTDLSCSNSVAGTTVGATESLPGCVGTANDDVWYYFEAIGDAHTITINNTGGSSDIVTEVFDACGGTSLICQDTPNSPIELTGLTPNSMYYFRIYTWSSTATTRSDFEVCVGTPPAPPSNIDCANATPIACGQTINASSNGSTGTQEDSGCSIGDNGIWFTFTGTGGDMTVESTASFDHEVAITSGACGSLVNIICDDGSVGTETHTFASVLNETYYVYIAHYASGNTTTGTIDVTLTCAVVPTCTAAEVASADPVEDCDNSQFDIVVEFTTVGDATGVSDGTNTYPIVGTTATLDGDYAFGTDVTLTVVHSDNACDFDLDDPVTFSACPPDNNDCAGALPLACGVTVTGTTEGATASGLDTTCGSFASTDGLDLFYTFNADGLSSYTVSLDQPTGSSGLDGVVFVYSGVCGSLVYVDCSDSGNPEEVVLDAPAAGTYTVRIFDYSGTAEFTLDLTCTAPPACTAAEFASAVPVEDCDNSQFDIVVEFTTVGDATGVSDGINTYPIVGTTATVDGDYAFGTDVNLSVVHSDSACDFDLDTVSFLACAPDNDDIPGAIKLMTGSTMCQSPVEATNVGATDSIENINTVSASCSSSNPEGDVWFEIQIPSTGEITVETSSSGGITDTVMAIYSGESGSLVEVACDDDGGDGLFSSITLTGLTPGEQFYVRVWEWNNDSFGTFNICAWSPTTLGVEGNVFETFTYYPNPVSSVLTLKAQDNISNVTVHNMLGQEVLRTVPNTVNSELDMSGLQTGAYFVKVTIGNSTKTVRIIKE